MGRALTVMTALDAARVVAPTLAEALSGRLSRDVCDDRLRAFGRRVVRRARIKLSVTGAAAVPTDRAFVIMSNHQSHIDIPVLYETLPVRTVRMVGKTELFKIPLFGQAMRVGGMVEVNRKNREQAVESLRRAGEAVRDGVSIWIAPEGTRSKTGALGPLKRGGFHLAIDTQTPILPVAINGTFDILPPNTLSMSYDMPVSVEMGAPIPVEGRDIDDVVGEVREWLSRRVGPDRIHAGV